MSVSTSSTRKTATGDGATLAFTFDFAIQQAADLVVYKDGVLVVGGYTVLLNTLSVGGTVTFGVAPAANAKLLMIRVLDLLQSVVLPTEGNFNEVTITNALDKLDMQVQQLQEQMNRCLRLKPTTGFYPLLETADPVAHQVPRMKTDLTGIEWVDPSAL